MSTEFANPSWTIAIVGIVASLVAYFLLGSSPRNTRSLQWSKRVVGALVLCFLASAAYGRYRAHGLVSTANGLAAAGDIQHAIVDYTRAIAFSPANTKA